MPALSSVPLAEEEIIGHDPLSSILVFRQGGERERLYVRTDVCEWGCEFVCALEVCEKCVWRKKR